jgi:hypothetical protein
LYGHKYLPNADSSHSRAYVRPHQPRSFLTGLAAEFGDSGFRKSSFAHLNEFAFQRRYFKVYLQLRRRETYKVSKDHLGGFSEAIDVKFVIPSKTSADNIGINTACS